MKQSFEVFEQSDGIALHLTVTVDGDAFNRPSARATIKSLAYPTSGVSQDSRQACRVGLDGLAHRIRESIERETTLLITRDAERCEQNGHRARQDEVNDLNTKIAELQKDLAAEVCAKTALTNELAAAKKAAKKPRTPRKAARK